MLNFETDLDKQGVAKVVKEVRSEAPVVRETVTTRRIETRKTHVGKPPAEWMWEELRDYVVAQIEKCSGKFPRDPKKETGIFMSFAGRWGTLAGPIAIFAFETCNGRWKGAPIAVTRFCRNSDPYFAEEIAQRLTA